MDLLKLANTLLVPGVRVLSGMEPIGAVGGGAGCPWGMVPDVLGAGTRWVKFGGGWTVPRRVEPNGCG